MGQKKKRTGGEREGGAAVWPQPVKYEDRMAGAGPEVSQGPVVSASHNPPPPDK